MKDTQIEWIGQIPDDWEVKRFKYCVEICNGRDYKDIEVDEGGFPVLGSGGEFARAKKYSYDKPSVLLGRKGTIDKPIYYDKPFWIVDTMFYTKISEYMNPRFTYYLATLIRFDYYSTQTALPSMTQTDLGSEKLPVPNITEQKLIADFLDKQTAKIDAIIKTNEEQLEVLKKYKKSLITQTVTKGLNKNARMKDSGIEWIGKIPEEWEVKHIKNHFSIISGSGFAIELQGKDFGDYPVCKAGDISVAGKELTSAANYLSKNEIKIAGFSIIPKGSIIFAKIGEAMKKNNRSINTIDCCLDNNCQGVIPHNFNSNYAYYVFLCIDMENYDNGGPIPCINNKKLLASKIPFPPVSEQQQIADYLDEKCLKIDSLISQKQQAIETMQKYKKSLIYEYVTGKKRIK